jgi:hypothetical protein
MFDPKQGHSLVISTCTHHTPHHQYGAPSVLNFDQNWMFVDFQDQVPEGEMMFLKNMDDFPHLEMI